MSGGYMQLDLNDTNLTIGGNGIKIKGTYAKIEGNYRKAIMLTGLVLDGVECSDRWLNFRLLNGAYTALIGFNDTYLHLMLKIEEDDTVSIFEE